MAQNDRMTHRQTDGHGDSMTDPAQRAESVKIPKSNGTRNFVLRYFEITLQLIHYPLYSSFSYFWSEPSDT